jgi:cation transport ATPase
MPEFLASTWQSPLQNIIKMDALLTIAYLATFVVVFWVFFKSVNYFEKI